MKYILLFNLYLLSSFAQGSSTVKFNKTLTIAVNQSLPPYVFSHNDSGLQLEIIKAAFKTQGITDIDFVYMTNKRAEKSLDEAKVDAAMNYASGYIRGIYPSASVLSYQNVVVSLKKMAFKINSAYDLHGKSVMAFQNATAFLPAPFETLTTQLTSYEEVINQQAQVDHLMKEWVDVIIIERAIFEYYLKQYKKQNNVQEVTLHPIFSKQPKPVYFNSNVLRAMFDKGLNTIKQSGKYNAIMSKKANLT